MTAVFQPTRKAWADPRPDAPYASLVHMADEYANRQPRAQHGSRRMYEWYECRCSICTDGQRKRRQRRRS